MTTFSPRRTPEHRLADFGIAFGTDYRLELRYGEFMKELVERYYKARRCVLARCRSTAHTVRQPNALVAWGASFENSQIHAIR